MATTYQEYTGNASTTTFSYPFPVLKTEDIKVALNGVTQTTGYTATTSPAQVVFSSAPATGVIVRVYRDTDVDAAKGVFAAGSSIRAADLNNNQDQVLYALQEEQNQKGIFESITLDDDVKIKLGNSDDFTIEWDTSNPNYDKALLTSTGNTHFHAVDSNIVFYTDNNASSETVRLRPDIIYLKKDLSVTGYIYPSGTGHNIGHPAAQWNDLYIDGTGYIDTISADTATINGNLVVTGTISDSGGNLELSDDVNISGHLRFPDDKKIYLGNGDDAYIDWDTDGWFDRVNIRSNGDIWSYVPSGKSHLFVVNDAGVLGVYETYIEAKKDLKPGTNNSFDLGKSDKQWKDLYVDGTGYIDTLNADSITGQCIVDSGLSTSNSEVYSAKRAGEIFYQKGTLGEIQSGETWVADDLKVATTAAIDARIVDLVDDVGGFVPIANETSFPNTNPDVNNGAGTLISVPLANTLTSDGNGNISINNGTLGNSTVVIANAGDTKTYAQGFGIIVETTTTLNTYNFHRYVPKATEVTTVAGSIANVNTTAGAIANVNTVAGISGNVTTVAGVAANVTTVAGVAANVTTVAGISSNVTTVAGDTTAINNITSNLSAVQGAATNATNAASSATAAASSATAAASSATSASTSATTATTQATTATTQATNAATSASTASTQATNAGNSATTATTQASNASTSAANALAYRNTTLTYRNDASAILTQVESAPYNLSDSASTHTAWGDITDTGANAVFTNESSNILLTMAEGSSSYNYGSIT